MVDQRLMFQKGHQLWRKRRSYVGKNNPNWKNGITFRVCPVCGKEFRGYKEKHCSKECYSISMKKFVVLKCLNCEKEFSVPFRLRHRKYCSLECAYKSPFRVPRDRVEHTCKNCGKQFNTVKSAIGKYCSHRCKAIDMFTGKKYTKEQIAKRIKPLIRFHKKHPNFFSGKNNPMHGRKRPDMSKLHKDPEFTRKRLKALLKKPNKAEMKLLDLITKHNLPFKYVGNGDLIIANKNPDFVSVDGTKRIIELWGDYWHKTIHSWCNSEDYYDPNKRISLFKEHGYDTIIIWESELRNEKLVLQRVREF